MLNPYITDRPLGGEDLFIGRTEVLSRLHDILHSEHRLVLLFGKPHIGKTSLLNQFVAQLGSTGRMQRVDWSAVSARSGDLCERIVNALCDALDLQVGQEDDSRQILRARCAQPLAAGERASVVAIDGLGLEECASGNGWAQGASELAELLRGGSLLVIIAVEARPEECQATAPELPTIVLSGLSLEETEDLLLVPVRGAMTYDLESMRRIYALTGGEPYLVQLYGYCIFEQRAQRGWAGIIEVELAVDDVIERAAAQFAELWGRCGVPARIVLCVFSEGIGTHGIGSADDVRRRLQRERVEMPLADVEEALDELRQRDLVERLGGGLFRFRNALFLRWLRANRSLVETVRRTREYRRLPRPTVPPILNRRIDWLGLSLWVLIAALIVAVAAVWRSRETRITWTDAPPTATLEADSSPAAAAATMPLRAPSGRLVYQAKAESGHYWDIYTMQSDGLDPIRLTQDASDNTGPACSPDGKRIAFVSDREGNREIYVMDADGANVRNLSQNAAEDWTPSWSPDGTRLAFASFRDGNWEIYVMDADGANAQRITRSSNADYAPAWSPTGDAIAFVSDRSGNLDVYLMAPDGSDLRTVTTDTSTDQAPAWAPDGRQLLWESYRDSNMEIMAIDVTGGAPRNLTQDAYADDHGGIWSPSGDGIAYFSNHNVGWDIFTLDLRTGQRVNITQSVAMEQYPVYCP